MNSESELKIGLSLGEDTEVILQEILDEIDEETLDKLTIERELESSEGLAGEPITIGAIVAGSTAVLVAVLRIIERRMEHKHQERILRIVAEGFERSSEVGQTLADVGKKGLDVSIEYGIAKEAWGSSNK